MEYLDHPNEQVCYYVRAVNEWGVVGFWSEEARDAGGTRLRPELSVSGGDAVVEGSIANFTVNAFPPPVTDETLAFSYTVSQQGDFVAAGELGRKDVTMTDSGEFRISVPTVPDQVDEAHGSVTVTLNGGSGYDLSSARSATVAVMDDETVQVNFLPNQNAATVGENIGRHNVAVAISPAPAADLTIGYTVGGSADASDDYRIAGLIDGSGTVTARRGQDRVDIPVQVVNDGAGETDETVILTLAGSDDYGLAMPTTYTLTIRDDDGTGVGFNMAESSVAEDVAGGTHEITINLTPAAPAGGLTINYNVSGGGSGRAVSPDDYTIAGVTGNTGTVTAAANASSVTIPVTIINDTDNEGDETVELTLRSSADYKTVGRIGKHTLTILDDDRPRASFASGASSVGEDAGSQSVTVELDPAPPADLTLRYRVNGTATRNRDYTMDSYSAVTVPANDASVNIPVTITDDGDSEPAEWVDLTLLAGPDYTLGTLSKHRLVITDDDLPGIAFNVADASVSESSGTYRAVIDMEPGPHEDITINYSIANDSTAGFAEDYAISNPGTVTARRGSGRVEIPISIIDDGAAEAAEKVILTLDAGDGYNLAGAHEFTLTIEDNDAAVASFRETEDEVSEGTAWATATVELNQALDNDVTINYAIRGRATRGDGADDDYTIDGLTGSGNTGSVTVPSGERSAEIRINIRNDGDYDGEEMVVLALTDGLYNVGTRDRYLLTILDDEEPPEDARVVSFSNFAAHNSGDPRGCERNEGQGGCRPAFFTYGGDLPSPLPVVVKYVGGTATLDEDFTFTGGPAGLGETFTVTVPANAAGQLSGVPADATVAWIEGLWPIADGKSDDRETIIFRLVNGPGYRVEGIIEFTMTIRG